MLNIQFRKECIEIKITPEIDKILQTVFERKENDFQYGIDLKDYSNKVSDENSKNILNILCKTMLCGFNYSLQDPLVALDKLKNLDFVNGDFENLEKIVDYVKPLLLKSRIYEILRKRKNFYEYSQKAIETYRDLIEKSWDLAEWYTYYQYVERANTLACYIGKNSQEFKTFSKYIEDKIEEINGKEPLFLSISLIKLAIKNGSINLGEYPIVLRKIIIATIKKNNIREAEMAFDLAIELYKSLKNNEAKVKTCIYKAKFLEKVARKYEKEKKIAEAIKFYEKAIFIYRNNKPKDDKDDSERILLLLVPLKQKYIQNNIYLEQKIDCSKQHNLLKKLLIGRSLQEQITILIITTNFRSKEYLAKQVIDNLKDVSSAILDEVGRKIKIIPPLDLTNSESNLKKIEDHMHREALNLQIIEAQIFYNFAINIIQAENPNMRIEDLDFLIGQNDLIPEDRKHIFKLGIMYGLNGDYYVALHLLVPQIENFFREVAKMCGGIVTTFAADATEESKVLGPIFDMEELKDYYGEDVIFLFKGLLNEKSGANLRNLVAHGIIDSNTGNSFIAIYFLIAVIKLCSYSSEYCIEKSPELVEEIEKIYKSSEEHYDEI